MAHGCAERQTRSEMPRVEPVCIGAHWYERDAESVRRNERARVGERWNDDRCARGADRGEGGRDRMLAAGGDQHMFRRESHAAPLGPLDAGFAQHPRVGAVGERVRDAEQGCLMPRCREQLAKALWRRPRRGPGHDPRSEIVDAGRDEPAHRKRRAPSGLDLFRGPHEAPASHGPGREPALLRLGVSSQCRRGRDAEMRRELANGGQALAAGERSRGDGIADRVSDPEVGRPVSRQRRWNPGAHRLY